MSSLSRWSRRGGGRDRGGRRREGEGYWKRVGSKITPCPHTSHHTYFRESRQD